MTSDTKVLGHTHVVSTANQMIGAGRTGGITDNPKGEPKGGPSDLVYDNDLLLWVR